MPPEQRPFEVISHDLAPVFGDVYQAYLDTRKSTDSPSDPAAFGAFVAGVAPPVMNTMWLFVLCSEIDKKDSWIREFRVRVADNLLKDQRSMAALEATILYFVTDVITLRNRVKVILTALGDFQLEYLRRDRKVAIGKSIKAFNRDIRRVEVCRNRLIHSDLKAWNREKTLGLVHTQTISELSLSSKPARRDNNLEASYSEVIDGITEGLALVAGALDRSAQEFREDFRACLIASREALRL